MNLSKKSTQRILLAPLGSWGDVNPFLWIGRLLQAEGYEVDIMANPYFESVICKLGFSFIPVGTAEQFDEGTRNPDIWHPRRGTAAVFKYMIEQAETMYELTIDYLSKGQTPLVFAPSTAFGIPMARQKKTFPLITIHLQPIALLSIQDLPHFGYGFGFLRQAPLWMRRTFMALGNYHVQRIINPKLGSICMRHDIPFSKNARELWWHSKDCVINLFPEWFAPTASDWPDNAVSIGFPLYDQAEIQALPQELDEFLSNDSKPIVLFTPGSAMNQGTTFFQTAMEAIRSMNVKGIFISRYPEQIPDNLPPEIKHFTQAPFSKVFKRCAAIVHHGGIGTTSQALAAGVPQLIMPMAHDQPDNAHRIKSLGTGNILYPRQFTISRLQHELELLLTHGEIQRRCRAASQKIMEDQSSENFLTAMKDYLE